MVVPYQITSPKNLNSSPSISSLTTSHPFQPLPDLNIMDFVTVKLLDDGSNFLIWRNQFESFLISSHLYEFVDRYSIGPEEFVTIDGTQTINQEFFTWRKINSIVMSCLNSTFCDEILRSVTGFTTAREIWIYLEKELLENKSSGKSFHRSELNSVRRDAQVKDLEVSITAKQLWFQNPNSRLEEVQQEFLLKTDMCRFLTDALGNLESEAEALILRNTELEVLLINMEGSIRNQCEETKSALKLNHIQHVRRNGQFNIEENVPSDREEGVPFSLEEERAARDMARRSWWCFDSGAWVSCTGQRNFLRNFEPLRVPEVIELPNGQRVGAREMGTMTINTSMAEHRNSTPEFTAPDQTYDVQGVRLVEGFRDNLISVMEFTSQNNCSIEMCGDEYIIRDLRWRPSNRIIAPREIVSMEYARFDNYYYVPSPPLATTSESATTSVSATASAARVFPLKMANHGLTSQLAPDVICQHEDKCSKRQEELELQNSESPTSLSAAESALAETRRQYGLMLESKQLSKHLKEISQRKDQVDKLVEEMKKVPEMIEESCQFLLRPQEIHAALADKLVEEMEKLPETKEKSCQFLLRPQEIHASLVYKGGTRPTNIGDPPFKGIYDSLLSGPLF